MEKNKSDQSRLSETVKSTNQPPTKQEKISPNIDTNNSAARRDKQNGSIQDNQDPKDKINPILPKIQTKKEEINPEAEYAAERDEEMVYGTDTEANSKKIDSMQEENKRENPYIKEGNL